MRRWEGRDVTTEGFDRRADGTTRLALEWLESEREPGRPFFLFVHYFDPHAPYDPPASHRARFTDQPLPGSSEAVDRYDEEIAYTDAQMARLLDGVRGDPQLRDRTLVVIVGDHGEGLGQHGHMAHGINIYEEAVRVPLLMWWPEHLEGGSRVEAPVSVVDVAPTILGMLGVDLGDSLPGRDLQPAIAGRSEPVYTHPVVLYRRYYEPRIVRGIPVEGYKLGVRSGRWKLIVGPAEGSLELFDLENDPLESANLAAERPETVSGLLARLQDHRRRADLLGGGEDIAATDRARLRALGYIR